jgi:tRNA dimethylallyltransferase
MVSRKLMESKTIPIILIAGPTGVGKTALSLQLASQLNTEIINADSMQVYRYMDIGTAKPTPEERALVPHHLIDVANPDESFDAARYLQLVRPVINVLHNQGKIPLVVGGTGLYMKVLTRGICNGPPEDSQIREKLGEELRKQGLKHLHEELLCVDPLLGNRIHPNDRQRIIRALEVYRATGKPLSHWQEQHRFQRTLYSSIKIFLYRERNQLYERINRRVHLMVEQGFLDEVRYLLEKGYGLYLKPMQSLGYRHLVQYLTGEHSLEKAIHEIQKETRHYAKRQLTWFRGDPQFRWFHAEDIKEILQWIEEKEKMVSRRIAEF